VNGTPKFSFNRDDLVRVLESAAFSAVAAGLGYLASNLTSVHVSGPTVLILPLVVSVLSAAQKFFSDTRTP